jgi:DNA-cytosine methyltransferase
MNILSLFDGISAGRVALERAGIKVDNYYASEVDKYAIQVSTKNYPDIKQLGDVTKWREWDIDWSSIDLVIGGSPCQGFSFAGKQLNFEDPRSKLFFDYVDICHRVADENPKMKFFLENVRMKKEYQDVISGYMGVQPIMINSSLVSAQNRVRFYWTNIQNITQPEDKGIVLSDIIDNDFVDRNKYFCLDANYFKGSNARQYICKSRRQVVWVIPEATKRGSVEVTNGNFIDLTFIKSKTRRGRLMITKSNCLTATKSNFCLVDNDWFRLLTPIECERLQTFDDNWTEGISNSQRYKALGNSWTVDVITHIFKNL